MTENPKDNRLSKIVKGYKEDPGFITNISRTLKLVVHLILDRRVSPWIKLLPIGALAYLISPLDAAIPAIDDALVIGLGTYTFMELCPPEILREHQNRIAGLEWPEPEEEEIIEVPYTASENYEEEES